MKNRKKKGSSTWQNGISGYVLLAGAVLINICLQGTDFFRMSSMGSLTASNLPLITVTLAQMMIMAGGGIDISLGNIVALSNGLIILLTNQYGLPFTVGCLAGLGAGAVMGLLNGSIIAGFGIPPLLVTFAMSTFIKGLSLTVLPKPGGSIPPYVYKTYSGTVLGIPVSILILLVLILILLIPSGLRFGKYVSAVGSNERNAYISGIPVYKIKILTYTLGGAAAGAAGICLTAMTASGDVRIGEAFALQSIAAVIIGGTLGTGNWKKYVGGSICGALFLAIVNNIVFFAFNLIAMTYPGLQISTYYQQLLSNFIIIFGLMSAVLTERRTGKQTRRKRRAGADEDKSCK